MGGSGYGCRAEVHDAHLISPLLSSKGLRPYDLRTKLRLGGNHRGLYRVLGEPFTGYATNLVQGSYAAKPYMPLITPRPLNQNLSNSPSLVAQ